MTKVPHPFIEDLPLQGLYDKPTPFFLFDLDRIKKKIQRINEALGPDQIFYAVKSNSLPEVLATIAEQGCGFEVNNAGELRKVVDATPPPLSRS
ncbi:MAG: hypothetical protein R6U68_06135 [Desulfobacteraceae bacterium]